MCFFQSRETRTLLLLTLMCFTCFCLRRKSLYCLNHFEEIIVSEQRDVQTVKSNRLFTHLHDGQTVHVTENR